MQKRRNSSALAMELRLSCTNPSVLDAISLLIHALTSRVLYVKNIMFLKTIQIKIKIDMCSRYLYNINNEFTTIYVVTLNLIT